MTGIRPEEPDDNAVERWLAEQRLGLIADLAEVVDLDAGLREVTLAARHRALVTDLAGVLDLEAGLDAIMRPAPTTPDQTNLRPLGNTGDLIDAVAALPPTARLTLRGPVRRFANVLELMGQLRAVRRDALSLTAELRRVHHADRTRTIHEARRRAEDLDHALNSLNTYDRCLDSGVRDELSRDLDRARGLARAVAPLDPDARRDAAEVRRVARAVADAYVDFDHSLGGDLDRAEARVSDFGRDLADRLGINHAIGRSLNVLYTGLGDAHRLVRMMDDYTGADLRDMDLTGVVLDGVRWSDDTRWPSAWIEWITRNSVPVDRGVYVIRPGTATASDDRSLIPH